MTAYRRLHKTNTLMKYVAKDLSKLCKVNVEKSPDMFRGMEITDSYKSEQKGEITRGMGRTIKISQTEYNKSLPEQFDLQNHAFPQGRTLPSNTKSVGFRTRNSGYRQRNQEVHEVTRLPSVGNANGSVMQLYGKLAVRIHEEPSTQTL